MTHYQEITLVPQTEISSSFILGKLYTQLHLALVELQDQEGKVPIGISFPNYRYKTNACDFTLMSSPPIKETLDSLLINPMGAYVLSNDKLYYIHQVNREFIQIALNDNQLARFNVKIKLNEMKCGETKLLSKAQLDEIRLITGYVQSPKGLGDKLRVFGQDEAALGKLNLPKWLARLSDYVHCTSIRPVPSKVIGYTQYRRQHFKGSIEKLARRRAKRHGINFEEAVKHYPNKVCGSDLPYIQLKSLTNQQSFRLFIEKISSDAWTHQGFTTYGLSSSSTVPEF